MGLLNAHDSSPLLLTDPSGVRARVKTLSCSTQRQHSNSSAPISFASCRPWRPPINMSPISNEIENAVPSGAGSVFDIER